MGLRDLVPLDLAPTDLTLALMLGGMYYIAGNANQYTIRFRHIPKAAALGVTSLSPLASASLRAVEARWSQGTKPGKIHSLSSPDV